MSSEKEILGLEDKRFIAMIARDLAALEKLTHEQLLYTHSSGVTDTKASWIESIKAGKAKGLAVTTAKRSSAFPALPTMNAVYPGFESDNWYAMFFPAGTPRPIVDKLNAEIGKALKAADIREFMPREALDPVASTPEELGTMFRREIERYAKIIRAGNIKLD